MPTQGHSAGGVNASSALRGVLNGKTGSVRSLLQRELVSGHAFRPVFVCIYERLGLSTALAGLLCFCRLLFFGPGSHVYLTGLK